MLRLAPSKAFVVQYNVAKTIESDVNYIEKNTNLIE